MNTLPPDRASTPTEASLDASANLDQLSIEARLELINREDATIAKAVHAALPAISDFVRAAATRTATGGRLIYVGAGTSGRLGVLDASECPPTFMTNPEEVIGIIAGGSAALRTSSEGLEDDFTGAHDELAKLNLGTNDALLGITAGGTTPFALGAIDFAHSTGAYTGLLTCGTRPTTPADIIIHVNTGAEILTGSTRLKAGTATKMVLNMISTAIMIERGKVHGNLMVDLRATNNKLRDRAARVLSRLTDLDRNESFNLLGRADGSVKAAAVMHHLTVDRTTAEHLLAQSSGNLRKTLKSSQE